ncbi:MAG: zonular occludens toxin domain-containing protein [Colwellia sp.]|nr:zonular occludens toxin domain-containing protein [Colwellia sp.]
MIHGISGKPGGGKSYEAVVRHIIPVVTKDKRKVVTNLPLDIDRFCDVYGDFCRDLIEVVDGQFHNYGGERPFSKKDHYLQYEDWQNEKGQKVYFFIDECHLAMPTQGTEKELAEFYSMHRHYGFDIMLITQNFRKVNRDIKDMVVNHYRAIKKSMMGQDDRYILKVHDGAVSSRASEVATHERMYEKKYFSFYQSHTKSDSAVEEATSNDIEKWYKHWSIKASVVFFLLGFFIVGSKLFSDDTTIETNTSKPRIKQQSNNPTNDSTNVIKSLSAAPVNREIVKTEQQLQYEKRIAESKSFHPFYKMELSVSGSSEYTDNGFRVKVIYFSATQNGQHIFTINNSDLLMAGYDIQVLGECAVAISYFDYSDYLTCNAPTQSISLGSEQLAANN